MLAIRIFHDVAQGDKKYQEIDTDAGFAVAVEYIKSLPMNTKNVYKRDNDGNYVITSDLLILDESLPQKAFIGDLNYNRSS